MGPRSAAVTPKQACTQGRSFVVVRHAEKASTDKDPSLSDRGRARASVLATMLGRAGVTRLIATEYKRTRETLAPLAEKLSLTVEVKPANETRDLISELRSSADGTIAVVATHSNVLPLLVTELSGARLRGVEDNALAESDFSRVVVITEPCGATKPSVMELCSDGSSHEP